VRAAAAVAPAAALAGSGCGSDASAGQETELGPLRAGSVAALAQCSDWTQGSKEQKVATVQDIRDMVNQTGTVEPTTDLDDEDALALLDRACENDFASGFRLYKLYTRGSAFSSITGDPVP
jgi:hypothetical protein